MEKVYRRNICSKCSKVNKCKKINLIKTVTGKKTDNYSEITEYMCQDNYNRKYNLNVVIA